MAAIWYAIWTFLVALVPLLEAFGAAAIGILAAIYEIIKITAAITAIVALFDILFDPRGAQRVGNLLANLVSGASKVAKPLLTALQPELQGTVAAFVAAFQDLGPELAVTVAGPIGKLAAGNYTEADANLAAAGASTPDNAVAQAGAAFKQAFAFGMSSAATAAAFESLFPEKLNVLNGAAPAIGGMAGFREVTSEVLGPLYRNAFGRSLEYKYRSQYKPDYPDEFDAVTWHARRLLTDAQLETIFGVSGLKAEYEPAFVASAYRAVPPFLLARAAEAGAIPDAQLNSILQFDGYRDQDIAALKVGWAYLAVLPYINQYITAAVRSTELGVMTPQELGQSLTQANLTQDQQAWIQLTVATRKLEQLAELYRKSISEGYRYGTITDAQYVPSLEAIGIGAADAQAHYAVDSIAKTGKAAVAAVKAAERLAAQQMRAAGKAAIQGYRSGTLDAVALEAALLLAGYDPTVADFTVTLEALKQEGMEMFLYGVTLPRPQALLLREQVVALGKQVTAQLVTPDTALAALAGYGVPAANAQALVADWAATHTTASDVGVLLPR